MNEQSPLDARQDIVDAEYGSGHAIGGPTGGQVAFDLLFGILAPVLLIAIDPALFVADVADRAVFPPYWATPTHIVQGGLVAALFVWGITGMRRPLLGMLLAGPFAAGALFSLVAGGALLWFGLAHSDLLSGWLAFTPWLTAFVFSRHCVLACRAGAHRSVPLTILLLGVTFAGILLAFGSVAAARQRQARLLESLLLSESPADVEHACARIVRPDQVDLDRVALSYAAMKEDDSRRKRLQGAYLRLAGAPIESALDRLLPRQAVPPPPPPDAAKEAQETRSQVLDLFFSSDFENHARAADALLTHEPDQKVLDAIARRYAELPEDDPRRGWIANSYTSLNSEGETIKEAVKRLQKKSPPAAKEPHPPASEPKAKPRPPARPSTEESP